MEQQKETSEQILRKRGRQTSPSFPLDLTLEVLLKLHVKSILRFHCVSKLWSSITTDPSFTSSFVTQSTKKSPSLLLCFRRRDDLFVFSIPQHHQTSNEPYSVSSLPVDRYRIPYPKHCSFSPKVSVNGLICFPETAKPILWNPSTRQFLTLPKPETSWTRITVFLGHDPVEGKHKVVCMPFHNSSDECRVSTLGSPQEPWRRIKTNHSHRSIDNSHECINGVLYYKAYTDQTDDVAIIMSFDVRSEKFHMIKLPWNSIGVVLTSYEGKLACVRINKDGCTRLWILEDAEKHDWSRVDFPSPIPYYDESLKLNFHFIGITSDGEFVYIPVWLDNSFYILYYDPKRNRFHRVEFMGIADDEFRLKYELGDTHLYTHNVVLNHIESLISL